MNQSWLYHIILRTLALVAHAGVNIMLITAMTDLDITGSWLLTAGFTLIVILLITMFIIHLVSFVHFLKTKT